MITASCGCKIKRVMYSIWYKDIDRECNKGMGIAVVCSKCFHRYYKKIAIKYEGEVITAYENPTRPKEIG